jgi:hypothetical protein
MEPGALLTGIKPAGESVDSIFAQINCGGKITANAALGAGDEGL